MKIKTWRRGFQIFFFILIIYGGFLAVELFGVDKEVNARGTENTVNVLDASLPIHSCRYDEPKPTLFEGCGIRYLLDRPLYFSKETWIAISHSYINNLASLFYLCKIYVWLGLSSWDLSLIYSILQEEN